MIYRRLDELSAALGRWPRRGACRRALRRRAPRRSPGPAPSAPYEAWHRYEHLQYLYSYHLYHLALYISMFNTFKTSTLLYVIHIYLPIDISKRHLHQLIQHIYNIYNIPSIPSYTSIPPRSRPQVDLLIAI